MASDNEIKLYNEIIDKGCCKRCALRYLGCDSKLTCFDYPNTALINYGFLSSVDEFEIEPSRKVQKLNPCSVCLGVLQDEVIEDMLASSCLTDASLYETEYYITHLTIPTCILVRDHSMKLHLKKTFPETFNVNEVLLINRTWRYTVEDRLSKILKKTYSHRFSKLIVHFFVNYELDNDELAVIQDFMKQTFTKFNLSRHTINSFIENVSDEDFSKLVSIPPKIPFANAIFSHIQFSTDSIYLLRTYCKYSRNIPQTNLGLDGEITQKVTIERIISEAVTEVIGECKQIIFAASGYELPSVRILGTGRNFYVKLIEPKLLKIPLSKCREIEMLINKNKCILVRNLREGTRKDAATNFGNEKLCARSFKLLCLVEDCKNINRGINAINMYRVLTVSQKTPITRLHQRPMSQAKKSIYFIKAKQVKDNLIEVDLTCQGGLAVEEFISGDMGRTTPSLSEIMKTRVEVIALDLTGFQTALPCALEEDEIDI